MVRERGAVPILAPTIEITPAPPQVLDPALDELVGGSFKWLVLTSRSGAEALLDRAAQRGIAASELRAEVAAIGEGTAQALRERGVEPSLVPDTFTSEALGRSMPEGTGHMLLARADIAPSGLEEELARKGWTTERLDAYRTTFPAAIPVEARRALEEQGIDAVTFTSASTVAGYVRLAEGVPTPLVASIGPVTTRAAREAGMRVAVEARPHTIEGLVVALEAALRPAT